MWKCFWFPLARSGRAINSRLHPCDFFISFGLFMFSIDLPSSIEVAIEDFVLDGGFSSLVAAQAR